MRCLNDFYNLVFPRICPACGDFLVRGERTVCLACIHLLTRMKYHSFQDNPVARLFWGRVWLENATAIYQYDKGTRLQALIHELKYRGRQDIGYELGRLMGNALSSTCFRRTDLILPVPLHPNRLKNRGYNQCDSLAEGLSCRLRLPFRTGWLQRKMPSPTQTGKTRIQRWENVSGRYSLSPEAKIEGKHILLLDDVITTGATLEACANVLLATGEAKVSVAVLGVSLKVF